MKTNELPSQERLQELFRYNPETGVLMWATREESKRVHWKNAGKVALNSKSPSGYKRGSINRISVRAHRIIFKLVHGIEPDEIDHINGDRSDNRIANLRSCSRRENMTNLRSRRNGAPELPLNVTRQKSGNFTASIKFRRRTYFLGTFPTKDEASAAAMGAVALASMLP